MARWAVEFAYDGRGFHGWARQPTGRTVEGEIRSGLVRCGIVPSAEAAMLEVSSRTDRAVSARANVLALRSDRPGPQLLRRLNGIAPDLRFLRATPIGPEVNIRHARWREYRYFEPAAGHDAPAFQRACRLFAGRLDVRSLGRGLPADSPVWRDVEGVWVRPLGPWLCVEVRAPSFVWGMVRKIIGAMGELESGRLEPEELATALAGHRRLTLPMAPPEPLVLWRIDLGLRWRYRSEGPTRGQLRHAAEQARQVLVGTAILRAVYGTSRTRQPPGADGAPARPH